MKFLTKRNIIFVLMVFALLIVSFVIYNIVGKADEDADKIAIRMVQLTGIDTGTASFDSDDNPGNDSSKNNRVVRSFDTLTYHFSFAISGKNDNNDYGEGDNKRKVNIKVTLPDSVYKYVSFEPNIVPDENRPYTFEVNNVDSYSTYNADITLYVLGAPNGTQISPKFEIQESTNTDENYVITLGNNGENNYYEYSNNTYSTTSSISGFDNYMPSIVSSKMGTLKFKLLPETEEERLKNSGQVATYNDKSGRYLTYILGVELVKDSNKGIKGSTMPEGNITFNMSSSQNGNITTGVINDEWVRLYGAEDISNIKSVAVNLPYSSASTQLNRRVKYAGDISKTSISNYGVTFEDVKANADGTTLSNDEHLIGTYAITVFSERTSSDLENEITNTLTINNISVKDTAGQTMNVNPVSSSLKNAYYSSSDYSLTSGFYSETGSKIAENNGYGSVSKGTTTVYKTEFNYSKSQSHQGFKEIIKIDSNAYRFVPINEKNIKITTNSDKLKEDDFEVKFVTGGFENSNYDVTNSTNCPTNINDLSINQIMNLYGGPCIAPKENIEKTFEDIASAKTQDEKEIPITKVIVQTKKDVILPDNVKITIEVGVRVRNVSDITQTYQAVSLVSTSDYDSQKIYYVPRVTNDENSVTNPDNYRKTIYNGNNIGFVDTDSPWGDSLKIVNFTSRQNITVDNKNSDGSMKVNYNANNGTTLLYNIETNIGDLNEVVGADDVWYINNLKVRVVVPSELTYVPDSSLGTPEVSYEGGNTILVYTLPYTKPNMKINDIKFKAIIKPNINGSSVPITVTSRAQAININGETDTSYIGLVEGKLTIYVTGLDNVIVSQKVGSNGSVVEKDSEFSYILSAYNNTNANISDYSILDILPGNGDKNGSKITGNYKVKVTLPNSLANATVKCSTKQTGSLINEVFDTNNTFEDCDVANSFVDATAIKIDNISIEKNKSIEDIIVTLKPTGNNYDDKYINSFVGASQTHSQNKSNNIEIRVVSRNISGKVFDDINENGTLDGKDNFIENIPITLYKVDSKNDMKKVEDTVTDKNGYYKFKNLDVGKYKVRASYNKETYDLTLRYANEDTTKDSDAYKVEEGLAEINTIKSDLYSGSSNAIRVTRELESISDMNIGLISRKSFGFNIDKFITRVDLTYNNQLEIKNYPNQKIVKEDVRNSLNASAKVYYGIKIENKSNTSGYVKLINENIPAGTVFDENDEINKGWFFSNGQLQNISLADDLIGPGETRYLTVALSIPPSKSYASYINTVTLLEVEQLTPIILADDTNASSNSYSLGEAVTYAGVDWHVINVENKADDEQILTLLADSTSSNSRMGHTANNSNIYKWSDSLINKYINSSYIDSNSLNAPILVDNTICDDASGLPVISHGGTLVSEGKCQSGIYNTYKIRLLNEQDLVNTASLTDKSWLFGNNDFWIMNSASYTETNKQEHDVYGRVTNDISNKAKYLEASSTSVKTKNANTSMEVRPVITISNKNIISE